MLNIAIFASGNGTNAENLMNHFQNSETCKIVLLLSNKKDAFALERAKKFNVPGVVVDYKSFTHNAPLLMELMDRYKVDVILLAGFLLKVPECLLERYPGMILNIHPALLPKFGGKGMYGDNVHKAVLEAKEKVSGITIHMVDENYDNGHILYQAKCEVTDKDTVESLAAKIHKLEQSSYPEVVEVFVDTILRKF